MSKRRTHDPVTANDEISRELDLRTMQLGEALAREAATAEILRAIKGSPNDTGPVFDAIVKSGAKLFPDAAISIALPIEGQVQAVAVAESEPARAAAWRSRFPFPLTREYMHGVAILDSSVVDIPDVAQAPDRISAGARNFLASGYRAVTMMPLMRGAEAIGVLSVVRLAPGPLTPEQVSLLDTFAEQAVIAIENVRQYRQLEARLEREAATRRILQVISASRADEKPVFEVILESASRLCNAPLTFLSMVNEAGTHVNIPAIRSPRPEFAARLAEFDEPLDRSPLVAVRAIAEASVIRIDDCAADELYRRGERWRVELVDVEGVRSILVVPMIRGEQAIGAIILYRREVEPFSDDHVELVKGFAAQAVIAVDNVKQFKALEARTSEVQAQSRELQELNRELETRVATQVDELDRLGRLRRFLSPQVADAVVSSGDEKLLGSHRALIAVLFGDIRGFTTFCETAEPEEAIELLQTYHEEMGRLIQKHGVGVDHRAGDGIMAIFNDPLPCDDPAGDALRLALAMRDRMGELCADWRKLGHRLGYGIGISLGYATVGMVGSEGRYDYTASGTAVNLASRLCDRAVDGEILLSPRAFAALEDRIDADSAGELTFKGMQAPIDVYRAHGIK